MIEELSDEVPVVFLCRYFGVSESGYYAWRIRALSASKKKKIKVVAMIKKIFSESKNTYGSPRVWKELKSLGIKISKTTVCKYMKELNLDARLKKRFRVMTTDSNHSGPIAGRIFKSEESLPSGPYEVLAGDITYLRVGSRFIYLAVVMDLYNREIVGWSMSQSLNSEIVVQALKMALLKCNSKTKIVFHSDRGSQYASRVFLELLNSRKMVPSMSRKGNCYDNCYVESWFKSLKSEWIYRRKIETENEMRSIVFEYIELWYNRKRRHSSLDYLSPVEYKLTHAVA